MNNNRLSAQSGCQSIQSLENKNGSTPHLKRSILSAVISSICCISPALLAAPQGGTIVGGQGSIQQSSNSTVINQASQSLAINWDTFNVGADESVRFNQPSSSSVALNRIVSESPSAIFGRLDANGRVFLINPNGILFGQSAIINVGSLLASTLDIDPQQFMQGDYTFSAAQGQTPGIVVNQGMIQAATGGSVSLVGSAVSNEGAIVANLGQVNLAAGRKAVMDFDGDGLIRFEVSDDIVNNTHALSSAVNNSGQITADAGEVLMKGSVAADVFSQAVNNDGIIKAARIENKGGVIRLVGNNSAVVNSGSLDVSGQDASSTGGTVAVLGDKVALNEGSSINASGDAGGGTVLIGGDTHGANPDIQNATQTSVSKNTRITADAKVNGDGGKVVVWSDDSTAFYGDISVRGGAEGGNGGFVEISGKQHLTVPLAQVNIDRLAPAGNAGLLLLDPGTVTICHTGDLGCTPTGSDTFDDAGINATLATGDLAIDTINATSINGVSEDINFVSNTISINWTSLSNFTLLAGNDINFMGAINWSGNANFTMNAGNNITLNGIISGSNVSANLVLSFGSFLTLGGGADLSGTSTVTAAGNGTSTIVGQDLNTSWTISGANSGVLSNAQGTINYTSVSTLNGGSGNDSFFLSGGSAGVINGGAGRDTINLVSGAATQNVNMQLNSASGVGSFSGIEAFVGNNTDATIIGADANNNINITAPNAGTIQNSASAVISFSNFNNVMGGNGADVINISPGVTVSGVISGGGGDDTFVINNTNAVLTLDGGTGLDFIDLSAIPGLTIQAGGNLGFGSLVNFEGVKGNNTDSTIVASNTGSTINVTSLNSGNISDGINSLQFAGFPYIYGGNGNDIININADLIGTVNAGAGDDIINLGNGASVGSLSGGNGNDMLNVDFNGSVTRNIIFDGTAGTNSVVLLGGGTSAESTYMPLTANSASISYIQGGNTEVLSLNNVGTVTDNRTAATLTVNGNSNNDTITLSNSAVDVSSLLGITYTNKANLTVSGGGGTDTVDIAGTVSLPGTLTIDAENINEASAGTVTADTLAINGATSLGNISSPFMEDVNNLQLTGVGGDVFITEASNLNILASDVAGNLALTTNGAVTQSGSLQVTGTTNISASSNAITLNNNGNDFGGAVTLVNSGTNTITLNDANMLAINNITGSDVAVTSGNGDIQLGHINASGNVNLTVNGGSLLGDASPSTNPNIQAANLVINVPNGGIGSQTNQIAVNISGSTSLFSANGQVSLSGPTGTLTNTGGLVVGDSGNLWNITGPDNGAVGDVNFQGLGNLTAGNGGDTFHFVSGGNVSGTITGGNGNDTLNFADAASPVTVNLGDNSTALIGSGAVNGFSNIETIIGAGGSDIIPGSTSGAAIVLNNTTNKVYVVGVNFNVINNADSNNNLNDYLSSSAINNSGVVLGARALYAVNKNLAENVSLGKGYVKDDRRVDGDSKTANCLTQSSSLCSYK